MRFTSAVALLLLAAGAAAADDPASALDQSLFRTEAPYSLALRGVTGSQIRVRYHCEPGLPFAARPPSPGGERVGVKGLLAPSGPGRYLLTLAVTEDADLRTARTTLFTVELADGGSTVSGVGWNSLYEVKLLRGEGPDE
jgi:hypothetical protein